MILFLITTSSPILTRSHLIHAKISEILTRLLHPTAYPIAVLNNPSIPLAPLFPDTRIPWHGSSRLDKKAAKLVVEFAQPRPYISASRMTMLFPRNKLSSLWRDSETTRATCGSVNEFSEWIWNDISQDTWKRSAKWKSIKQEQMALSRSDCQWKWKHGGRVSNKTSRDSYRGWHWVKEHMTQMLQPHVPKWK